MSACVISDIYLPVKPYITEMKYTVYYNHDYLAS